MQEITLKAYAKINLALFVGGKRPDGYHELSSVMQSVSLYDLVTVKKNDSGKITINSNSFEIPLDETNIAVKAAKLMKDNFSISSGFDIYIEKNIPIGGGMAGGSTNAAAVILAICKLENLEKSIDELCALGKQIGADVPFCIFKETALAEGIGEKLKRITPLADCYIVLVNPNINISTGKIFNMIDSGVRVFKKAENLVSALCEGNFEKICSLLDNDMQSYTLSVCPEIDEIIAKLKKAGAKNAIMSGSGSTCFGLFKDLPNDDLLKEVFKGYWYKVVRPLNAQNI